MVDRLCNKFEDISNLHQIYYIFQCFSILAFHFTWIYALKVPTERISSVGLSSHGGPTERFRSVFENHACKGNFLFSFIVYQYSCIKDTD